MKQRDDEQSQERPSATTPSESEQRAPSRVNGVPGEREIDPPGHHLRAADEDDFDDAERDGCRGKNRHDDAVSDS